MQRTLRNAAIQGLEMLEQRAHLSATISGSVMRDMTGNGLTADDQPLAGSVVKLYKDVNANGKLDSADGAAIASKTSNADGRFKFTGLKKGRYLLQGVAGANQVRTAPVLGDTIAVNAKNANGKYGGRVFDYYVKDFDRSAISNITYTINGTKTVTSLVGNVKENDTVTANFTVAAGKTVKLSLVTYYNPLNGNTGAALQAQRIFDVSTGTFGAGKHSLTVLTPDCYFQIDLVGGPAINKFGPTGSNITYSAQSRLIHAAHGGDSACDDCGCDDHASGRMTGGGSVFLGKNAIGGAEGTRVTHGFQLHCAQPPQDVNNRLEINWSKSSFHLLTLTSVECRETAIVQAPPKSAPIDTLIGAGDGRFNGTFNGRTYKKADAKIEFTLTDGGVSKGEPGRDDTSDYRIVVLDGNQDGVANDPVVVLDTNGPIKLTFGNHQAHKEIAPLAGMASQVL